MPLFAGVFAEVQREIIPLLVLSVILSIQALSFEKRLGLFLAQGHLYGVRIVVHQFFRAIELTIGFPELIAEKLGPVELHKIWSGGFFSGLFKKCQTLLLAFFDVPATLPRPAR